MTSVFQRRASQLSGSTTTEEPIGTGQTAFQRRASVLRSKEPEESFEKSAARYAMQIPQGIAATTTPGLVAGLWQMLAQGEVADPEEIDRIEAISEREGIPFDREAYMEAAQEALGSVPTVSNIAGAIERRTGIPLEPKTRGQKALRFGTEATRLAPEGYTLQGMETALPKPVLGAGILGAKEAMQQAGVPEPIAELASFGVLKPTAEGAAKLTFTKEKPSGLTERGFEKLKAPKEVSASRLEKINEAVETDFKNISDQIIKESPVGETFENLRNNPAYKQESRALLDEAQQIANEMPEKVNVAGLKKEIADTGAKAKKGFMDSEYDREYSRFMKANLKNMPKESPTMGQLVEQYRKNNAQLGEYFEPGASKALNRAKRDAILDHNRAIASYMKKTHPESELVRVFEEGNSRWKSIMDTEVIDDFVSDLFDGKINYKKGRQFFDDPNTERIFKRALGDKYLKFEQLMNDMMGSESAYRMLKVAKEKGYSDLFQAAASYIIHPSLAQAKMGYSLLKHNFKSAINALLDKPQLGITWHKAVQSLKKGDFKAAEAEFKALQGEIEIPAKAAPIEKAGETIEGKAERISPERKAIEYKQPGIEARKAETPEPKLITQEKPKEIEPAKETAPETKAPSEPKAAPKMPRPKAKAKAEPKFEDKPEIKADLDAAIKEKKQWTSRFNKLQRELDKAAYSKMGSIKQDMSLSLGEIHRLDNEIHRLELELRPKAKTKEEIKASVAQKRAERAKAAESPAKQETKIKEAKRQDISKQGLKQQKQFLLDKIDSALANPPKEAMLDFHVPGDGDFKLKNDPKALAAFRKRVEKLWPDKAMPSTKEKHIQYPAHAFKESEILTLKRDIKDIMTRLAKTDAEINRSLGFSGNAKFAKQHRKSLEKHLEEYLAKYKKITGKSYSP